MPLNVRRRNRRPKICVCPAVSCTAMNVRVTGNAGETALNVIVNDGPTFGTETIEPNQVTLLINGSPVDVALITNNDTNLQIDVALPLVEKDETTLFPPTINGLCPVWLTHMVGA